MRKRVAVGTRVVLVSALVVAQALIGVSAVTAHHQSTTSYYYNSQVGDPAGWSGSPSMSTTYNTKNGYQWGDQALNLRFFGPDNCRLGLYANSFVNGFVNSNRNAEWFNPYNPQQQVAPTNPQTCGYEFRAKVTCDVAHSGDQSGCHYYENDAQWGSHTSITSWYRWNPNSWSLCRWCISDPPLFPALVGQHRLEWLEFRVLIGGHFSPIYRLQPGRNYHISWLGAPTTTAPPPPPPTTTAPPPSCGDCCC